jgi:hypothetical protein
MRRVSDNGLVEIADLDINVPVHIGERPKVTEMAVTTDPHRPPCGNILSPASSHS